MCDCCLGVHCVRSWSRYGLKQGISWQFIFFSLFLLVLCVTVHKSHKHVQGWNPTTMTYFPGRHNNNNKHREKKKLGEEIKEVVVV